MIKIIDAPCGAGKTTWAILEMNANKDGAFVYCTPYLDEIERIRNACGRERFHAPVLFDKTKLEDFNDLLSEGVNICVTHSTFLNCTEESIQAIYEGGYTLILDEALDIVSEFNDVCRDDERIKKGDPALMINKGMIRVDPSKHNRVEWIDESWDETSFSGVKRFAELGRLYCIENKLLVAVFPPEVFTAFADIYVLTFQVEGSNLFQYFSLFGMDYEKKSICESDGDIDIVDWTPEAENKFKMLCAEKIKVCDDNTINRADRILSKTWYEKALKGKVAKKKEDVENAEDKIEVLKGDIRRFLRSLDNPKSQDIMITCPKEAWSKIKGKGYCGERQLTKEEMRLPETERKALLKQLSCFVPCNARATNDYRDRSILIYAINMFMNPEIKKLFTRDGIKIDEDQYALSCLLQWVARSRLRDGGEVHLYLPSARMRRIFTEWIDDVTA